MKIIIFIFAVAVSIASVLAKERARRAPYELPDGTGHLITYPIRTTFVCEKDGYYADQDNNCQIFHVCHSHERYTRMYHWSFMCGPETIFNQASLTCTYPKDAVPCERAHEFYSINDKIGDPKAEFLTDDQIGGRGGYGGGSGGYGGGGAGGYGGGYGAGGYGGGGHGSGGGRRNRPDRRSNEPEISNKYQDLLDKKEKAEKRKMLAKNIKEGIRNVNVGELEKKLDQLFKDNNIDELNKFLDRLNNLKALLKSLSKDVEALENDHPDKKELKAGVQDVSGKLDQLHTKLTDFLNNRPV